MRVVAVRKREARRWTYFGLLRGSSSGPLYGAAFAWPSNAGALIGGVVAQALLPVTKADAFHTLDTGKSACATPHAAHDRPCTRIPKRSFPDVVPRRRAKYSHLCYLLCRGRDTRNTSRAGDPPTRISGAFVFGVASLPVFAYLEGYGSTFLTRR